MYWFFGKLSFWAALFAFGAILGATNSTPLSCLAAIAAWLIVAVAIPKGLRDSGLSK